MSEMLELIQEKFKFEEKKKRRKEGKEEVKKFTHPQIQPSVLQ